MIPRLITRRQPGSYLMTQRAGVILLAHLLQWLEVLGEWTRTYTRVWKEQGAHIRGCTIIKSIRIF